MNAPFHPRLRISPFVAEYCGSNALKRAAISRAADAILVGSMVRDFGGSVADADLAELAGLIDYARSEISIPLSRERFPVDEVERGQDGMRSKLTGELVE